ncbi:VPLPA-CTERM sorting domain-containing protein, partial [Loktanella sp. DJP18]|uniref:VPLPA-CTERM sorting domain-containing protein n=1 Tax=Loktanella sp. DJP18 TaxID=3409788 RepID=UPI003BB6AD6C
NIVKIGLGALTMIGGLAVANAAAAATINFNTSYNAPQAGPLSFTNGSETVNVSGSRVDGSGNAFAGTALIASYTSSNGGLGICTSGLDTHGVGDCDSWGWWEHTYDDHLIDGKKAGGGAFEMAFFDFGTMMVALTGITFSYADGNDDFDLKLSDGTFVSNLGLTNNGSNRTYSFATPYKGSIFGIGANHSSDGFKIRSISYDVVPPAVPVPAAGFLLIGALAGFGALRRRKAS